MFEKKVLIRAFIFDFDDTLKSSVEPECNPLDLIEEIFNKNKLVGIITASGVSVLSVLAKQIVELIKKDNYDFPVYLGIANGMALYKIDSSGITEMYSYQIEVNEVKDILCVWKNVMKKVKIKDGDLVENGISIFEKFLLKDWGKYLSNELLFLSKKNKGRCFIESNKVTFVMPKNYIFSQQDFISLIQMEIDKKFGKSKFIIEMGNDIFAHLTKSPGMSPKLFALRQIMKDLNLNNNQIAAFGDMPFGNDKGLLIDSELPYTFTNSFVNGLSSRKPPFILPGSKLTPVANVYKAVENLL